MEANTALDRTEHGFVDAVNRTYVVSCARIRLVTVSHQAPDFQYCLHGSIEQAALNGVVVVPNATLVIAPRSASYTVLHFRNSPATRLCDRTVRADGQCIHSHIRFLHRGQSRLLKTRLQASCVIALPVRSPIQQTRRRLDYSKIAKKATPDRII